MGERDTGEKQGKGHQGTCMKDTWTKPKGQVQGWEMEMGGAGKRGGVKMETTVLEQQ